MSTPTPTVSPELKALMRKLKLGRLNDTLPERLALAKTHGLSHVEFLEQLFSDEAARRDGDSAGRRARAARLDPDMVLEAWDDDAKVTFDREVWSELISMRFVEQARNAFILGPVGVGKTFMATALGHVACRRRISVHFERAEKLHKRLKAARLDASHDAEMRKLIGVDLLIIDDFALTALGAAETADIYEIVVERHRSAATVLTSNRDPVEWLAVMADPLLAQSAVDRMKSAAWSSSSRASPTARTRSRLSTTARRSHCRRGPGGGALDMSVGRRDHLGGRPIWARGGPMLLATRVVPWDWQTTGLHRP